MNDILNILLLHACVMFFYKFHDVLPGSSVEIANDDAKAFYVEVVSQGRQLLTDTLNLLTKQVYICTVFNYPYFKFTMISFNTSLYVLKLCSGSGTMLS